MPFDRKPTLASFTSSAFACSLIALSLSLGPATAGAQGAGTSKKAAEKKQEVVEIDDRDPAMTSAFKKAQATLDDFLKVHASKDPGMDSPSVRIKLTEGKVSEYVWLHPFEKDGAGFKGTINGAPTLLKNVSLGSKVSFKREDIVDWTYFEVKARRMHGNFTTCVQLSKAPAAEVEALKKAYGLDCSKNL